MEKLRARYWELVDIITTNFYEDRADKSLAYLIQTVDPETYTSLIENYGVLSIDLVEDYAYKNHKDDSEKIKTVAYIIFEQRLTREDTYFQGLLQNARYLMSWEIEDYRAREEKSRLSHLRDKIEALSQ